MHQNVVSKKICIKIPLVKKDRRKMLLMKKVWTKTRLTKQSIDQMSIRYCDD